MLEVIVLNLIIQLIQCRENFEKLHQLEKSRTLLHGSAIWNCILVSLGNEGNQNYLNSLTYGTLYVREAEV